MTELEYQKYLFNQFSLEGKLLSASALLPLAAKKWPKREIVICDDNVITYDQLYKNSLSFAQYLIHSGVCDRDKVIIFYENSIEFFIAYFAIWSIGAIVVPLNIFLTEAELLIIVNDCKPKVIIISQNLKTKLSEHGLAQLPVQISNIDISQDAKPPVVNNASADSIVAILYTSGTTGVPKGVMLSSKNIISNAIQAISRFKRTDGYKIYCPLPLFHSLPQNICVWANILIGGTAIIAPKIDRKSITKGFEHKPDIFIGVPAIYGMLCILKDLDFSNIEYFISGGDALPNKIKMYFELIYKRKICNGYGLTECSPFIAVDFDEYTQPNTVVGAPLLGVKCQIRDEANNIFPDNEIGILWVQGDNVMLGYYNHEESTNDIIKDGWLCTGDLAKINLDGKLEICGRQKDLIINKGIKIYPQEIENILSSHPSILQAAVIGVNYNEEEIPVAFISVKNKILDEKAFIQEVKDFCIENLAAYKVPRSIIIKDEIPLTSTGKIDKKKLKAEA